MSLAEFIQALSQFVSSGTDRLWIVDNRAQYEGSWDEFQSNFNDCDADFLATEVRCFSEDPEWYWWNSLKAGSVGNPLVHEVAALLPLVRVSQAAARAILQGIEEGWAGHPEVLLPTLTNRAGLKIEDLGGSGSFTPPARVGRWYDKRTWNWRGPVAHVPGKLLFPLPTGDEATTSQKITPEPRVAFLFLTRGDVYHPKIWREYFEQAGDQAEIHAHTQNSDFLTYQSFLYHRQIRQKVETSWGSISLVHATLGMIRAALQSQDVTHFVLVSESCVPVRPFDVLSTCLRLDDRSRMGVISLDEVRRANNIEKANRLENLRGIPRDLAYFQDQWMCLSREDAEIVTEKDWSLNFKNVYAPDEAYFATVLAASGKPPGSALVARPVTWTDWSKGGPHPTEYHQVSPHTVAEIAGSGCFFARKFFPGSDIGKWGLHK